MVFPKIGIREISKGIDQKKAMKPFLATSANFEFEWKNGSRRRPSD